MASWGVVKQLGVDPEYVELDEWHPCRFCLRALLQTLASGSY